MIVKELKKAAQNEESPVKVTVNPSDTIYKSIQLFNLFKRDHSFQDYQNGLLEHGIAQEKTPDEAFYSDNGHMIAYNPVENGTMSYVFLVNHF